MSVRLPGALYAALQVAHPAPGALPDWLHRRVPPCATGAGVTVDQEQAEQLADLVALALWECQQADGEGEPFTRLFAETCTAFLDSPTAARHTRTQTEGQAR
ncbi:hypothetical protein AR457_41885 (plasmid) [Streptomyces agglomeratus]|uniref:hypothetical protein n=1 Tax=Streptomyces agglomeratus TaxID=285458 RepID=UPI000854A49F|nr:hypothetical protein [Streptomyces agglomeratus]OEJ20823.1 hypothetical protein AR457_41885 [Streptomyces agglomeratus]